MNFHNCLYVIIREITSIYSPNDASKVRAVKARFAKPVFPGQTIRTDMWKEGEFVLFECSVEETGKPCLTGGWIKLSQDLKNIDSPKIDTQKDSKSDVVFGQMAEKLTPDLVKKVNAVFRWIVTGDLF